MHSTSRLVPSGALSPPCAARLSGRCPAYGLPRVCELPRRLEPSPRTRSAG